MIDDHQEFWRAANLLEDLEEPASAHQVKGFGEVHKGEEQWLQRLSTLLLQLTEGEDRIHCEPPSSEATLYEIRQLKTRVPPLCILAQVVLSSPKSTS